MKIGIIVAMERELALLLPLLSDTVSADVDGFTLIEGRMCNTGVVVMKSGIGKVNAALGAAAMIHHAAPDLIINSGVAGGTGAGAAILDVVLATEVAYHDVWCGPGNLPGQVQGLPQRFSVAPDVLALDIPGLKRGLIASGDQFVDTVEALDRIRDIYPDVMAVDMESAPIAQVCRMMGVPFASVRVVSDTPGLADNTSQYLDFWTKAPEQTFGVLRSIVESLDNPTLQ